MRRSTIVRDGPCEALINVRDQLFKVGRRQRVAHPLQEAGEAGAMRGFTVPLERGEDETAEHEDRSETHDRAQGRPAAYKEQRRWWAPLNALGSCAL